MKVCRFGCETGDGTCVHSEVVEQQRAEAFRRWLASPACTTLLIRLLDQQQREQQDQEVQP